MSTENVGHFEADGHGRCLKGGGLGRHCGDKSGFDITNTVVVSSAIAL